MSRLGLMAFLAEDCWDGYVCLGCGAAENLSIDHIVPFSQGGACHVDNFQTLCRSCNAKKHAHFVDLRAA